MSTINHRHLSNLSNISRIASSSCNGTRDTKTSSVSSYAHEIPFKRPNNLRIAVMNWIASGTGKLELEEFTNYAKPDLMLITETKIDKNIQSSDFLPEDYIGNIRKDHTVHGRGVMIAARKGLDITGLEVCENTSESVWIKLMWKTIPQS